MTNKTPLLKGGTCFSGIGAPELGGDRIEWLWSAEFERNPSKILDARFPNTENLGDVTADDLIERAKGYGPLDVLVGGPPCQAFSFAGLRKSLEDDRGNLSLRFVELAHAIRPRNLLVENVPGWLSTDDNAFGCFLGAIVGANDPLLPCERKRGKFWRELESGELVPRWPSSGMASGPIGRVAWRVFDAQYFGLAQRRKRVFVVVDFGEGADPVRVLFEPRGLSGNTPPSREEGQGIAGTLSARSKGGGGLGTDTELDGGLIPETSLALLAQEGSRFDPTCETMIPETVGALTEVAGALCRDSFSGGAGNKPEGAAASHFVAFGPADSDPTTNDNLSPTIRSGNECQPAIAFKYGQGAKAASLGLEEEISPTLTASESGTQKAPAVMESYAVRRLTPFECEILQGFPTGFTMIENDKLRTISPQMAQYLSKYGASIIEGNDGSIKTKALADGPRYKSLGNSWAVPCGRWILSRLSDLLLNSRALRMEGVSKQ